MKIYLVRVSGEIVGFVKAASEMAAERKAFKKYSVGRIFCTVTEYTEL